MNATTNTLFSFLGGIAVGAVITYGAMKKMGYAKPGEAGHDTPEHTSDRIATDEMPVGAHPHVDRASFDKNHKPDTHKVRYDVFGEKPDPEDLAKKYEQQMAEKEHPEDDTPDDGDAGDGASDEEGDRGDGATDDEEDDEEAGFEDEISEALMGANGEVMIEEIDGFGHVLRQANTLRKSSVIYVVYQDHAGEIYPLEDLTYYSEDKVLCDVTDTPVDNVDALVGDALDDFGGYCGDDPDVVYVRNCSMGFEYEIRRVIGYYGAHIYGVSDADMADVVRQPKRLTKTKAED